MAEDQGIRDIFDRMAGRQPTEGELAHFRGTSTYAVERYVRWLPEYNLSPEYRERAARIREMGMGTWGALYGEGGIEVTPDQISQWIRAGISDTDILYGWRTSAAYRALYAGKPAYMSESEYRKVHETKVVEAEGVKNAFSTFARRNLTGDELNKIFFGGPGSDELRREYTRVKGLMASYEGSMKRGAATQVQLTPLGPVQPLMRGMQSAAGVTPVLTEVPSLAEVPSGPRWASYADYLARNEEPAYTQWKNEGIPKPPEV